MPVQQFASGKVLGQQITFASEIDPDQKYTSYVWVRARHGDTIRMIAARRGHPETARDIAALNNIRSITMKLKQHRLLRLPGTLVPTLSFNALAGDEPPTVKDGYAVFSTVNRPGRTGITRFDGYNPIALDVPIRFEGWGDQDDGSFIEDQIEVLERMAGRGQYHGSGSGPPAVVRVSVTDGSGRIVPLVPTTYQWTPQNPTAPLWRIAGVAWGKNSWSGQSALRSPGGYRLRQDATVTIQQYTPIILAARSAAARAKQRNQGKKR